MVQTADLFFNILPALLSRLACLRSVILLPALRVFSCNPPYHCTRMADFKHSKAFGQHFLKSTDTAAQIVGALEPLPGDMPVLEIGPGLGVLSNLLLAGARPVYFSEIDTRIIAFLRGQLHVADDHILQGDFLKMDLRAVFSGPFAVIGNFPYNISSQILFTVLDHRDQVPLVVGMFQREMAQRVVAGHGNKDYGILSVLVQAYYQTEYLFELPPDAFDPPPKVHSAVIRLRRRAEDPPVSYSSLRMVVKAAFNQRRKTLSNALGGVSGAREALSALAFSGKRAEALSVQDFIALTQAIQLK